MCGSEYVSHAPLAGSFGSGEVLRAGARTADPVVVRPPCRRTYASGLKRPHEQTHSDRTSSLPKQRRGASPPRTRPRVEISHFGSPRSHLPVPLKKKARPQRLPPARTLTTPRKPPDGSTTTTHPPPHLTLVTHSTPSSSGTTTIRLHPHPRHLTHQPPLPWYHPRVIVDDPSRPVGLASPAL